MAEDKRTRDEDVDKDDDAKKQKRHEDENPLDTKVLESRLLLRYVMMGWFLSKAYCYSRPTRIPTIPRTNMGCLPVVRCMMVGGGFVASIARQLTMCATGYKQPRENDKHCCEWMHSIIQRATTGFLRKAEAYYKEGKALMFSQKFAEGAKALLTAIELGSDDAKALLAYFLVRGRKGLPVDRDRAFDLAMHGARNKSRACRLCLSFQFAKEVGETLQFTEWGYGAIRWIDKAMKDGMKVFDPDLVDWLYSLARGMVLSRPYTRVYSPLPHQTYDAANQEGKLQFLRLWPDFQHCEHQYNVGMSVRYSNPAEALVYLTNAARGGHPEALYQLARIFKFGLCGQETDDARGNALMEQAKEAGSVSAQKLGF